MKPLRVYLSSTFEDLKEYRAAVFAALEKAGLDVARMEAYTAADERPLDLCLSDVAKSDIYVGLIAWRYGYQPPADHGNPQGRSITDLEYRQAETSKLRKLLFAIHPDTKAAWPDRFKDEVTGQGGRGEALNRFRNELGTEKTVSFFRTPDELATLVLASIMRSGISGRPYNVPPLPAGLVPRPNLTSAIVGALLGATDGADGASTLVQGAGGFGKTMLAVAVCHRPEVVNTFPDGLLWTVLGEHPDLARVLTDLHVLASGNPPAVAGLNEIGRALAEILQRRRCLLVVDDVWRPEDLDPFLKLAGPRLLVTTRIRSLLEQAGQIGWSEVPVDEMEAGEAVTILEHGLTLDGRTRATLGNLANELGCWPLLLSLANARLLEENKMRPGKLDECIARVTTLFERKGVLGFDRRDSNARNAAVANSVDVGLERADEMYSGLAQKATELSIFPEDVAIPTRLLADLWALDEFDVEEEVVRPLHNLSLLQWDRNAGAIKLHDMIRRALEKKLTNAADIHRKLLDAWADAYRLPHDYAWRWFAWHCVQAKEQTRLRRLLLDFEWLQRKIEAAGINALLGDFGYLHDEREVALLQSALRASAHILAKQAAELATQLVSRVTDADRRDLQAFFAKLRSAAPRPWLCPLTGSLAAKALLRVIHFGSRMRAVAVSSDGTRIVSVDGEDDAQTVWDVDNGVPLRTVRWDRGRTTSISIGAARPFIVTTRFEQGAVRWDLETGECLESDDTPRHLRPVSLTVENESEHVVWWSEVSGGPAWIAITERQQKLGWAGDQHHYSIYVGDADRTIRTVVRFSDFSFSAAAIVPRGRRLITSSFPTGTAIWDVESGTRVGAIPAEQTQAVACDSNGEFVVTSSYGGVISVWRMDSLVDGRRDAAGHTRAVVDAQVSKDGTLGFTVSVDGTASTWDLKTGALVANIAPEASSARDVDSSIMTARIDVEKAQVDFLIRDADFRYAAGEISSYDLATGASVPSPIPPALDNSLPDMRALFGKSPANVGATVAGSSTRPLCISPDGARGVTESKDKTMWVWDVATGTRIASFSVDSTLGCCACTARAETIVVGEHSGRVHILHLLEATESG